MIRPHHKTRQTGRVPQIIGFPRNRNKTALNDVLCNSPVGMFVNVESWMMTLPALFPWKCTPVGQFARLRPISTNCQSQMRSRQMDRDPEMEMLRIVHCWLPICMPVVPPVMTRSAIHPPEPFSQNRPLEPDPTCGGSGGVLFKRRINTPRVLHAAATAITHVDHNVLDGRSLRHGPVDTSRVRVVGADGEIDVRDLAVEFIVVITTLVVYVSICRATREIEDAFKQRFLHALCGVVMHYEWLILTDDVAVLASEGAGG